MSVTHEPRPALRLFTADQRAVLVENGTRHRDGREIDPDPVVKLFLPGSGVTWLLTELDPDDDDSAFGLCDLGQGYPALGYVSLGEITSVESKLGLVVERDMFFEAKQPLSAYVEAARRDGAIIA
jgi:hypothetical protein